MGNPHELTNEEARQLDPNDPEDRKRLFRGVALLPIEIIKKRQVETSLADDTLTACWLRLWGNLHEWNYVRESLEEFATRHIMKECDEIKKASRKRTLIGLPLFLVSRERTEDPVDMAEEIVFYLKHLTPIESLVIRLYYLREVKPLEEISKMYAQEDDWAEKHHSEAIHKLREVQARRDS